jgi:hypothetical protein
MMASTMVGRNAESEGTRVDSDDEVEEIHGRPHDDANISMYGASVETTGPTMKRSPRSRRRRGWSAPPSVLSVRLR